jgi:hypothetical protein
MRRRESPYLCARPRWGSYSHLAKVDGNLEKRNDFLQDYFIFDQRNQSQNSARMKQSI